MTQTYTTTINAAGLETLLDTNTPLRIFDCRARLGDPAKAQYCLPKAILQARCTQTSIQTLPHHPVTKADTPCQHLMLGWRE
jgi:hypothetical protein